MTLTQSLIIIAGSLAVMVVAGLLLGRYLKHQNDHDPITGTTDVKPTPEDEPIPDAPPVPTPRKRNAKGQFVKEK